MTYLTKALLVVALLATAACNANANRFGAGGAGGAGGIDASGLGSPSDPNSLAYFNQTIGDRVLFAVDQHTLTPDSEVVLRQQAVWLMNNPSYTALVEGHADEQGTADYNRSLGDRRANAVRDYLVTQGVAPNRLRTISYGKDRPLAICSDESCYQQNRRAVTVLAAGAVS